MQYIRKLVKNPAKIAFVLSRLKLDWLLSDRMYLKLMYKGATGKTLNLDNPKTFNEKLQWLKLHDRKPEYTTMVDKYAAKDYVAQRIGQEYIIPTLGVWNRVEDIDFDSLPNQFVLKCTHDSGGLVVCRDKSKLDIAAARKTLTKSIRRKFYYAAREWPYKNVQPRIIAEAFMADENQQNGLTDYKFYCFSSKPQFLYVSSGMEDHSTASISFLNPDWSFAPFQRSDYKGFESLPPKPENYEKMLQIAETLSQGTSFLRVDLYEIDQRIYFSELTFYPCGGTMPFNPDEWDRKVGELLKLPEKSSD